MKTQERVILYVIAIWIGIHIPGEIGSLLEKHQEAQAQQNWQAFYDAFPEKEKWASVGLVDEDYDGTEFRWVNIDDTSVTIERPASPGKLTLEQARLNDESSRVYTYPASGPWINQVGPNSHILIGDIDHGYVAYKVVHRRHHTR